jgi:aminomethyltransferase
MRSLRQTPLNATHRRLGAKLVDFSTWEMPLHYGSQIEEHRQVRRHAGMFDVSHMLAIDVQGVNAQALLEVLLANDVARLCAAGAALYSCMLNAEGGILDDVLVYRRGLNSYRVVVNAATAEQDSAWIERQADTVTPSPRIEARRELAMIAVQGPAAAACIASAIPRTKEATHNLKPFHAVELDNWYLARTGYTGEDGFEVMLPAQDAVAVWEALLREGVTAAGLGARDTLRIEAGLNLYGQDMDANTLPGECGLNWTVRLGRKRDFIGRARVENSSPRCCMHGLVLLDRGVLRSHQELRSRHGSGQVTSGSYSPSLDVSIALARMPVAIAVDDVVEVSVRNKWLTARVVKYPFVRHGRSLLAGYPLIHP